MTELIIHIALLIAFVIAGLAVPQSAAAGVLIAGMAAQFAAWAAFALIRRRNVKQLIECTMRVQDDRALPEMHTFREGGTAILQSELYKLVTRLSEQTDAAQREREFLVQTLSDISHQIKTPMTAITVLLDLLSAPDLSEEKRAEFIEKISRQTSKTTSLVQALLNMSKLDANVIRLKRQEVILSDMLDKIRDTFSILAEVREVELDISCPERLTVCCDEVWTTEALSNIVKNALEHTPGGGRVSVAVSQNNFFTDIVISDTGEGISPEDKDKIFTRFYKGENSSPDSVGIGLAMAKQIISLENGTISVSSTPGEGTAFTVRLYSDIVA